MPRRLRPAPVPPEDDLENGFAAIRRDLEVPPDFPAEVLAEAEAAARAQPGDPALGGRGRTDLRDVPFVTLDPPGSRDLDQAFALERRAGGGWRVRYAIADVAAFVAAGGAVDAEAWARGMTLYAPDARVPLHPLALSEGAASLLPAADRPACVWTVDLDAEGEQVAVDLRRAWVRSRAQLDYPGAQRAVDAGSADEPLVLLAEVGAAREGAERRRGGFDLPVPEQEVIRSAAPPEGTWTLALRGPLAVERHNAQLSLLTGMAAAGLMLQGGVGLLRTMPPPDAGAVAWLRRKAAGLGVPWDEGTPLGDVLRGVDAHAPRAPPSSRRPRRCCAAPATPRSKARHPSSPSTARSPHPTRTSPRRCAASPTAPPPRSASPWQPAPSRPAGPGKRCRGCPTR